MVKDNFKALGFSEEEKKEYEKFINDLSKDTCSINKNRGQYLENLKKLFVAIIPVLEELKTIDK